MNSRQIENWALRVIDCVKSGQPNEDCLVELKRDWISPDKAARRIAGHANESRGENILWLIGIDEKQGVIGVNFIDFAEWYSKVESFFNDLAPRIIPLNIPIDGKTVVALLFETDRSPFVVKNPVFGLAGGGAVELEVPWREKTSVRSAQRSDLIRLLTPLAILPEIEVLEGKLSANVEGEDSVGNYVMDELRLALDLYIVPKDKNPLVIPFHRCRALFEIPEIPTIESWWMKLYAASGLYYTGARHEPPSSNIKTTSYETIIDGPGKLSLEASAARPILPDELKNSEVRVLVYLHPTNIDRPIVITITLPYPIEELPFKLKQTTPKDN